MMRIVDIIYSLPDMLMVILLSVVLRETLKVDAIPFLQKLGTKYDFSVYSIRTSLLDRYGSYGPWTDLDY